MPAPLTETATYAENCDVPVDADAANAASVEAPFQVLADRTRYLAERLGLDTGDLPNFNLEWAYESAKTLYRVIPLSRVRFGTENAAGSAVPRWATIETGTGSHVANPFYGSARCWAAIELPAGATLVDVSVWLKTSSARAGAARWQIAVYRQTLDDVAAYVEAAPVLIGSATDDGGANGYTMITIAGLATAVSNGTTLYFVQIDGPTVPTVNDWLHALRYRYTASGPGGA